MMASVRRRQRIAASLIAEQCGECVGNSSGRGMRRLEGANERVALQERAERAFVAALGASDASRDAL